METKPLYWHFPIYLQRYQTKNQNRDSLFRTRPGSVVRYGDWKLHEYFEDGGLELYDLKKDLSENYNRLNEMPPGKKTQLLKLLRAWQKEVNAPIPTELNPEFEESSKN